MIKKFFRENIRFLKEGWGEIDLLYYSKDARLLNKNADDLPREYAYKIKLKGWRGWFKLNIHFLFSSYWVNKDAFRLRLMNSGFLVKGAMDYKSRGTILCPYSFLDWVVFGVKLFIHLGYRKYLDLTIEEKALRSYSNYKAPILNDWKKSHKATNRLLEKLTNEEISRDKYYEEIKRLWDEDKEYPKSNDELLKLSYFYLKELDSLGESLYGDIIVTCPFSDRLRGASSFLFVSAILAGILFEILKLILMN